MLPAMDTDRPGRLWLAWVLAAGLLLSIAAVLLTLAVGDPLGLLSGSKLALVLFVGLFCWGPLAWAVRRLVSGKTADVRLKPLVVLAWLGMRFAFATAIVAAAAGWLATIALGITAAPAFGRAALLLIVMSALTTIAAQALVNSMLIMRHRRGRGTGAGGEAGS